MEVRIYSNNTDQLSDFNQAAARLSDYLRLKGNTALAYNPGWLNVFASAFGHRPYIIEAVDDSGAPVGWLPLGFVQSLLFGRFLVSLPYLNVGGVQTDSPDAAAKLIDAGCELADLLKVKFMELRSEKEYSHPKLTFTRTEKVHLRLNLPETQDQLWKSIGCKARNQIRKGEKAGLTVQWGCSDKIIDDFYEIFAVNMRDLGTPVYGKNLFTQIRNQWNSAVDSSVDLADKAPFQVLFAVVYSSSGEPAAGAYLTFGVNPNADPDSSKTVPSQTPVLLHTEVPSASCKRKFNADCANMFLYWQLLKKSIEYKQNIFDFGRSSIDSPTYRFKTQWGAKPCPAYWQYYLRNANPDCMRPDKGGYGTAVRLWQKLPVWIASLIGPSIVKGIP